MSYHEELKHPDWQRKRLEMFKRDEFKCRLCGESQKQLHLHHICYTENKDWRGIPDKFLITLCEPCHSELHGFVQAASIRPRGTSESIAPRPSRVERVLEIIKELGVFNLLGREKPGEPYRDLSKNDLARRIEQIAAISECDVSLNTCKRVIDRLIQEDFLLEKGGVYTPSNKTKFEYCLRILRACKLNRERLGIGHNNEASETPTNETKT